MEAFSVAELQREEYFLEKHQKNLNVAGQIFHTGAWTSLFEVVLQNIFSIMFLIKFWQFLQFCGVKHGYQFLIQVFEVPSEIGVIRIWCSSCNVVLCDCLTWNNDLLHTILSCSNNVRNIYRFLFLFFN